MSQMIPDVAGHTFCEDDLSSGTRLRVFEVNSKRRMLISSGDLRPPRKRIHISATSLPDLSGET